jgi:2-polyprenyl-3-methyl-5-hydroxy-6-metoxy-1,4-benzoquinol methylase
MENICKICTSTHLGDFIRFPKYPKTISCLFKDPMAARKDVCSIGFLKCNQCHHIQIDQDMPQSFYEDYIMTVSHSNKMNDFQKQQAAQFIARYNLVGKSVLEVGCGDGNFLALLCCSGLKAIGNEPSKSFRELALAKGLQVDEHYITDAYDNPNGPFDAAVSREVMEHVPNPIRFLTNIRRQLKADGVILIEIPNGEKMLSELRYYDLFPDHLSYFTRESLTAAMLISGFKNVEIFYGMDNEFLYAFAENRSVDNTELKEIVSQINNDFKDLTAQHKRIVIWGSGGKGIATLGSLDDASSLAYVVDSDPFKQGKYLPVSGLLVKAPEVFFADDSVDALIITNLAYTDEIVAILKSHHFQKPTYLLGKNGVNKLV